MTFHHVTFIRIPSDKNKHPVSTINRQSRTIPTIASWVKSSFLNSVRYDELLYGTRTEQWNLSRLFFGPTPTMDSRLKLPEQRHHIVQCPFTAEPNYCVISAQLVPSKIDWSLNTKGINWPPFFLGGKKNFVSIYFVSHSVFLLKVSRTFLPTFFLSTVIFNFSHRDTTLLAIQQKQQITEYGRVVWKKKSHGIAPVWVEQPLARLQSRIGEFTSRR